MQVASVKCPAEKSPLPPGVMTVFSFIGAILIAASSSAVTPLYRLYQQSMHLTPFMITVVFAVYVVSLLTALLTVGGLSDYVGRRPVILAALVLNGAAMILFARAGDVGQLILARAVQGVSVGTGTTALGAAILDTNRVRGPLLNSVTAFLGLTVGALGAAALVTFAPDPLHMVYDVLLGITVLMVVLLWAMPESAASKAGAASSLWPHVSVPPQSKSILMRLTPANVATWSLGGFYLSLMPTVVATTMGVASPWVGGVVVATLMLAARNEAPMRLVKLSGRGVPHIAILFSSAIGFLCVIMSWVAPGTVFLFLLNSSGAIILFVYWLIALSQIILRRRTPAAKLRVKMWFFPVLSMLTLAGITAVLVQMAFDHSARSQLWLSLLSWAVVLAIYAVARVRSRTAAARGSG